VEYITVTKQYGNLQRNIRHKAYINHETKVLEEAVTML